MLRTIEYSDMESPDPNGYNSEPEGMKEITEAEFAQSSFFTYGAVAEEYRQIVPKRPDGTKGVQTENKVYSIHIFWMNVDPGQADGYALRADYYEGKLRYYRVGCDHEYREMSAEAARKEGHEHWGMHWHVCRCKYCGRVISYDSSG